VSGGVDVRRSGGMVEPMRQTGGDSQRDINRVEIDRL